MISDKISSNKCLFLFVSLYFDVSAKSVHLFDYLGKQLHIISIRTVAINFKKDSLYFKYMACFYTFDCHYFSHCERMQAVSNRILYIDNYQIRCES